MAYQLIYWQKINEDHYEELRSTRLISKNECFSLSQEHQRPNKTASITLSRTDRQSNIEHVIWCKEHGFKDCGC